jgi:hypothetical protein
MILNIPCKTGSLQVTENGTRSVLAPCNRLVWQVPCLAITGFTAQPSSRGTLHLATQTTQGTFQVDMVTKRYYFKLGALFPHLQTTTITGDAWYHDERALLCVATYTDARQMKKEVEAAARYGWIPQARAWTAEHAPGGRAVIATVRVCGWNVLPAASRRKETVTLTFVRAPDWEESS